MQKNGEINPHFRLIYDFQGLTQSEIPDSFLFERSVSFHVGPQNLDLMPTFNDVWAKILEPEYMTVLTAEEKGRQELRKRIMETEWGSKEIQTAAKLFSSKIKD